MSIVKIFLIAFFIKSCSIFKTLYFALPYIYVCVCLNCADTKSIAIVDCQFFAVIKSRGSHVVGIPLHAVMYNTRERII